MSKSSVLSKAGSFPDWFPRQLEVLTSAPDNFGRVLRELVRSGCGCVTSGTLHRVTVGGHSCTSAVGDLFCSFVWFFFCELLNFNRACRRAHVFPVSTHNTLGCFHNVRSRRRTYGNNCTWGFPFLLLILLYVDSICRLKFLKRSHIMSLVKGLSINCLALLVSFSALQLTEIGFRLYSNVGRRVRISLHHGHQMTRAYISGCVGCSSIAHQSNKWITLFKDLLGNIDITSGFTVCFRVLWA